MNKGLFEPSSNEEADINYALVETTRPSIFYRAMKYWGKKPHNIWSQYIERYCPRDGWIADPFAGSAVAAFEAVKLGRKAIAFDLNPLTSFMIEVTASKFNENAFLTAAKKIRKYAEDLSVYKKHFIRERNGEASTVLNFRWEHDDIVGVAIQQKMVREN